MSDFCSRPVRQVLPFNDQWLFRPAPVPECADPALDERGWQAVRLPHTNRELPFSCFDEGLSQFESSYRRHFRLDPLPQSRVAILHFEGVMAAATVWLNGHLLGEHRGGYTPFSFDVSGLLAAGDNLLAVAVDSRERSDIPPFGHVIDYLTYGGIYREVWLEIRSAEHVASVRVETRVPDSGEAGGTAVPGPVLGLELSLVLASCRGRRLFARLRPWAADGAADAGELMSWEIPLPSGGVLPGMEGGGHYDVRWEGKVPGARLWEVDSPALYVLELELVESAGAQPPGGGTVLDCRAERFGFRQAAFRPDGFFINGRRLKLRGLNRHQSWPHAGYAMPRRAQRADADILRGDLGLNIVRQSHYPQSVHFLERCDEIGLLVFAELPGWQHIGDPDWQALARENLAEMILRDRNHPSIVVWGVRINESADNEAFYRANNALARSLDPTRPTGGVRNFKGSQFLEDLYTYNDFVHSGDNRALEPAARVTKGRHPYLVSEHNGHMFPTKKYDPEPRRIEHALRHARVLEAAYASPAISGAIGWCAFDYNTHADFGSGDHICHHGVMDMYRIGKPAADLYASQADGRPFGRVATTMCPGDHDAASIREILVFTNSQEVRVWRGDVYLGAFRPDRRRFPHLPRPPVVVDDLIGDAVASGEGLSARDAARVKRFLLAYNRRGGVPLRETPAMLWVAARRGWRYTEIYNLFGRYISGWGSKSKVYRFEGWSDGRKLWEESRGPAHAACLTIAADTAVLREEAAWDCCRVEVRLRDNLGNDLSYCQEVAVLLVEGPLEIIGPASRVLGGGSTAYWLRTTGHSGPVRVWAQAGEFRSEVLDLVVLPRNGAVQEE